MVYMTPEMSLVKSREARKILAGISLQLNASREQQWSSDIERCLILAR